MKSCRHACVVLALLALGATARANTLHVPSEYATIQAAIDAAAGGDEIVVDVGIYEEQLIITKDITITGAGTGQTVIEAPAFMPHTVHPLSYNAVIHVELPATSVWLREFTIDGAGRGREDTRFTGIMYDHVGGRTEHVEIMNMTETPLSDAVSGIGFYSYSDVPDNVSLVVDDVYVHDFQKTGLVCFGGGCLYDIRNVTVDTDGTYTDAIQNGFELLLGSQGTLTNCTARMCWYDGDPISDATSVGFLFYFSQDWTVLDCVGDQDQTGVFSIATDLEIVGGTYIGHPLPLVYNNGITVVTTSPPAAALVNDQIGTPAPLETGDGRDASLDLGWSVTVADCTTQGANLATTTGMTFYSNFEALTVDVRNCFTTQWVNGMRVLEDASGQVVGQARSCRIADNTLYGVYCNALHPFDARGNYWGDPSGPYHPSLNPFALGDAVSDHVLFDPWLGGNIVCEPLPQYISLADDDGGDHADALTVRYIGGGSAPLYGFSAELTWDHAALTATVSDVARPSNGAFANASLFQVLPTADGLRIDAALGGSQPGVDSGPLFTVEFHAVGTPDHTEVPVTLTVYHLRDGTNHEISGCTPDDGLVIVDLQAPVISILKMINTSLAHTDDFAKNGDLVRFDATITDDDPLFGRPNIVGNFIQVLNAPGYLLHPDNYAVDQAYWAPRPASLTPADGPIPFSVTATDLAGNTSTLGAMITADNTPPTAISGFVAEAGHNQLALQWNDPTGLDVNLRHVAVRANRWLDYPQYATPEPLYPQDPTQGTAAYTGLGTSAVVDYPADGSARDIVYCQAFAVDMVDLHSPPTSGSHDRATNYYLGDVNGGGGGGPYDGVVDIYDVSQLGDTFNLSEGDPGFDAECDVGPTDDSSEQGIPLPDDVIDFEDLMIFSIQFDRFLHPPRALPAAPMAGVPLSWTRVEPRVWVLALTSPCPQLKGLRLRGKLPAGVTAHATAGALVTQQSAPWFLHDGTPGSLDASFAVLGYQVGIDGAGELMRVQTSEPVDVITAGVDARALDNASLATQIGAGDEAAAAPTAFAVHGNYPNPFNPATTIAFDLPSPQRVRLRIFALDGHEVATVLSGTVPAGRHEVTWRGCDDRGRACAAGIYVYRLQAGPWTAAGKLNLVK